MLINIYTRSTNIRRIKQMFISLFIYEMRRELFVNIITHVENVKLIFFTVFIRFTDIMIRCRTKC